MGFPIAYSTRCPSGAVRTPRPALSCDEEVLEAGFIADESEPCRLGACDSPGRHNLSPMSRDPKEAAV